MTWYLQLSQGIVTADVCRSLIWCSFYAATLPDATLLFIQAWDRLLNDMTPYIQVYSIIILSLYIIFSKIFKFVKENSLQEFLFLSLLTQASRPAP